MWVCLVFTGSYELVGVLCIGVAAGVFVYFGYLTIGWGGGRWITCGLGDLCLGFAS